MTHTPNALITVYLFLLRNEEVLFLKRRGGENCLHVVPSGGVITGESLEMAMIRHVGKKIGLSLDPKKLDRPCLVSFRPGRGGDCNKLDVFFVARTWRTPSGTDPELTIAEPENYDSLVWASISDLPKSLPEHILAAIPSIYQHRRYLLLDRDRTEERSTKTLAANEACSWQMSEAAS